MNTKLFLGGILLLSILIGCSDDRTDETSESPKQSLKSSEIIKAKKEVILKESTSFRTSTDSLREIQELINGNNKQMSVEDQEETIDPTKSDRPK